MNQDATQPSPFTRPGFLVAASLVCLLAVLGLVLGLRAATRSDTPPTPPAQALPSTSPGTDTAPATETTAKGDGAPPTAETPDTKTSSSICGLPGEVLEGKISKAPEANWDYQGTTAYPTSPKYGPAKTDPTGYRYCFQHSPQGALFAAANAAVQGSDPSIAEGWLSYVLADGPYRDQLLADTGSGTTGEGTRLAIVGFRILAYNGETARVDLAISGTSQGQAITLSGVYELVWQDGDWKISTNVAQPLNMAMIPDTAGYISWRE